MKENCTPCRDLFFYLSHPTVPRHLFSCDLVWLCLIVIPTGIMWRKSFCICLPRISTCLQLAGSRLIYQPPKTPPVLLASSLHRRVEWCLLSVPEQRSYTWLCMGSSLLLPHRLLLCPGRCSPCCEGLTDQQHFHANIRWHQATEELSLSVTISHCE